MKKEIKSICLTLFWIVFTLSITYSGIYISRKFGFTYSEDIVTIYMLLLIWFAITILIAALLVKIWNINLK